MPDSGRPEASPLAMVMMSGATPKCWMANHFPVRPKPDWISSAMSRKPCSSQMRRRPARKPGVGTTYPPSPSTGSTRIAAVSKGAVWDFSNSFNSRRQKASVSSGLQP